MYPLTYYETFMRYEKSDQIFVAMPFTKPFQDAYERVIEPAIESVLVDGKKLQPRIVNRGTTGSPDIREQIFDAIIHARLVIADMTVQSSYVGDDGETRWQANANVTYEVGLACTWRNAEDILLIHQEDQRHTYSFDVQNLRHISYRNESVDSVRQIADEILRAINQSTFIARGSYLKIVQSLSPSAIQFMHQESLRAFPVISFGDKGMPIFDTRIHAASELLACGAIKNRNVIRQGADKGVLIVYQWTELGLRMLVSIFAIDKDRRQEMLKQIKSVPEDALPPNELVSFPEPKTASSEAKMDSRKEEESTK
jgi:hypothetical protein